MLFIGGALSVAIGMNLLMFWNVEITLLRIFPILLLICGGALLYEQRKSKLYGFFLSIGILMAASIWALTVPIGSKAQLSHGLVVKIADETDMYTMPNGNLFVVSYNSEVSHMILSKYANADYKTRIEEGDSVWSITLPQEKRSELEKMFAD